MEKPRKDFSATGMIRIVRSAFKKTKTPQIKGNRSNPISLEDCLMSAFAMFSLKFPSLLQFDNHMYEPDTVHVNLKNLYDIQNVPSDTYMRERVDEVEPDEISPIFKTIFAHLQRGKALEGFQFINGYYLLSVDGTGFFSSSTVHCENCCVKEHRDGTKTYYHQMLCGSLVHPGQKTVIPLAPEPIMKSDGDTKNDCELNAAKRFIERLRREHPHLKIIFLGDGITSNAPFIKMLEDAGISYILGAKPGNHKALFEFTRGICNESEYRAKDGGAIHQYRFCNGVPLNDTHPDVKVNFLDYIEIGSKGKKQCFSWVTDLKISEATVHDIMRGGRCRWKIENETLNTLKNQNYHFEHNFGHGKKNLSTIFGMLMMLAFLIDQAQELCDALFQKALCKQKKKKYLWERMRALALDYLVESWEVLWSALAYGHKKIDLKSITNSS